MGEGKWAVGSVEAVRRRVGWKDSAVWVILLENY